MATVSVTEEFYNRNHSKADGKFALGGGGKGVAVKNDWHNANHALNEKNAGPAKTTKANSDVRPGPRSAQPGSKVSEAQTRYKAWQSSLKRK